MKVLDGLEGKEPIKGLLHRTDGTIAANMLPRFGTTAAPTKVVIVTTASNPAAVAGLRSELIHGATANLELNFEFIPQQYWIGTIRAAYLAVFFDQGYEYAFSEGARQVRNVIDEKTPVNPAIIMEAFPNEEWQKDVLVMPLAFSDLGECFVVLLKLKSRRARYLAVCLPGAPGCDWDGLGTLSKHAPRLRLETTPGTWTRKLHITFQCDPVSELMGYSWTA